MVEHRAVVNQMAALHRNYGVGPADIVLQLPSWSSAAFPGEVLGALCAGARLVLLEEGRDGDPNSVVQTLADHDVVSIPQLQQDIRAKFGLRIPQNQLRAVLTRVSKHGYIRAENRAYIRVPDRLAVHDDGGAGDGDADEAVERHRGGQAERLADDLIALRSGVT